MFIQALLLTSKGGTPESLGESSGWGSAFSLPRVLVQTVVGKLRSPKPLDVLLFNCYVVSNSLWHLGTAACQASLSFTNSRSWWCYPTISFSSLALNLCIRWPKHWSFSFSISPSHEYSGLISFRIDWFDLLAVQGTLKSLLQHHSSKALIFGHSVYFTVQLSHPYTTMEEP